MSEATMETFSTELGGAAPFIADCMTVCSQRQREFWICAGADGERIEVTGQPRFDVYASTPIRPASSRRRVLFLSYALDAYVPGAGRGRELRRTWQPLRDATEAALVECARGGCADVYREMPSAAGSSRGRSTPAAGPRRDAARHRCRTGRGYA